MSGDVEIVVLLATVVVLVVAGAAALIGWAIGVRGAQRAPRCLTCRGTGWICGDSRHVEADGCEDDEHSIPCSVCR